MNFFPTFLSNRFLGYLRVRESTVSMIFVYTLATVSKKNSLKECVFANSALHSYRLLFRNAENQIRTQAKLFCPLGRGYLYTIAQIGIIENSWVKANKVTIRYLFTNISLFIMVQLYDIKFHFCSSMLWWC